MSRRVKQVVYGIFYLVIIGIIVAGIYFLFLKPAPSCFDNVQNQGEQGVDCGGPCAKACLPAGIQPISALGAVHVFPLAGGNVTVLAQLENANSDYAAASFDYAIMLYGTDGSTTVATFTGTSFAYADETKWLILPNEPISAPVSSADIAISNIQWTPASQVGLIPQFAFTNITSAVGADGFVTVSGSITNRDISLFGNIIIAAVFKNAAGVPVGASQTELDSLAPGATQSFSISYPASVTSTIDVSETELHAYAKRN
jgi:hypothetical protein